MPLQTESAATPRRNDRLQARARRRFLDFYAGGFDDEDYLALERGYKERAHKEWRSALSLEAYAALLEEGRWLEIASSAVRIEARTNLLFSFEKMALRDAVRSKAGARRFAEGLFDLLHGDGSRAVRFERWLDAVAGLPRRQTRVSTWPVVTVFPFLADPKRHLYLKPQVTKTAAQRWGYDFHYSSRPAYDTYRDLLRFGREMKLALSESSFPGRAARDNIDVQGFLWVLGSPEYD